MGQRLNPFGVLQVVHLVSQDLSIAGKRAGLAGARSGLFMEQVRIVKEMREADKRNGRTGDMVRPRYLVWENVVEPLAATKEKTSQPCSKKSSKSSSRKPPVLKCLKRAGLPGEGITMKWEDDGAWCGELTTRNTGECPNAVVVSRLSQILEETPHPKYNLTAKACQGILRRAERRGKDLPERLKAVLIRQSQGASPQERTEAPAPTEAPTSYAVRIRGGCDGGGKGALVQTEKSGTLGTGNDKTIFCLQGNGIDRADTAGCNGKGWREDACYTLNTIDRLAVCAEVVCMTPWDAQSQRVYDGNGVSPTLSSSENSGLNREAVLCAGFKAGQGAQAGGIGYGEEVSPTLAAAPSGTNQTPAVVALDMTHACDVIRECGEQVPALQARMWTGGNQVPLTYQDVTGTLSPGAHAGSYNGQDAYNDMLVCGATPDVAHTLRAKANCAYREDAETYPVQNMVVRRLTPLECERLQGFPDGWTDIGDWVKTDKRGREIKVKGSADSPRYKALGNSIALPFWDWMLRRMARYLPEGATLGSLFDGIGGFPLCFERIHGKGTARWASEIEPFPIAVTKRWFGEE